MRGDCSRGGIEAKNGAGATTGLHRRRMWGSALRPGTATRVVCAHSPLSLAPDSGLLPLVFPPSRMVPPGDEWHGGPGRWALEWRGGEGLSYSDDDGGVEMVA